MPLDLAGARAGDLCPVWTSMTGSLRLLRAVGACGRLAVSCSPVAQPHSHKNLTTLFGLSGRPPAWRYSSTRRLMASAAQQASQKPQASASGPVRLVSRIAVAQMTSFGDHERNFRTVSKLCEVRNERLKVPASSGAQTVPAV